MDFVNAEAILTCFLTPSRNKYSIANKLTLFLTIFRAVTWIRITTAQQMIWFKIPFSLKVSASYEDL